MERVGEEKKVTKLWKLEHMSIQMKANCIADPGEPNPNPAVQKAETQSNLNPKILTRVRTGLPCRCHLWKWGRGMGESCLRSN